MSVSLADLLQKCLENEDGYKKFADVIANYVADPSKNIKLQMPIVNVVKETIKSKTHTSQQKLLCLKLLNRCFMKDNKELNRYVEKKILTRLGIFAQHNKEKADESDLVYKGELIFSGSEKDRRSAAAFLVLLLDCLERWAKMMPSEQSGKGQSEFAKTYTMLLQKKIFFPSQCRVINPFNDLGLFEEGAYLKTSPQRGGGGPANNRAKSQHQKDTSAQAPKQRLDAQKIAADLKQRMMRAKDTSKKSEAFLAKMEQNGFQAEPQEFVQMDELLNSGREHCEFCVESLMSEEIGPLIANKEDLLDRMLKYQEQILTAIAILAPFVESVKSQEAHTLKNFNQKKQNRATAVAGAFSTSSPGQAQKSGGSSTLDILSSLFPTAPQKPDKNDPFADAVNELQNKGQNQPQGDDFFSGFQTASQQQQHQQDFNFDFPSQQQQPQTHSEPYSQQQQHPSSDQRRHEEQKEEPKIVVGNGGDNYSVFKMMQEGMIDIEKERAEAKRKREEQKLQREQQQQQQNYGFQDQQQQYYNQQQQQQQQWDYNQQQQYDYQNQQYQAYQEQPVPQPVVEEEPNYHGGKLSDYAASMSGNDSYSQKKISDLEKQVRELKKQNTDMITSNQILKNRVESLKQQLEYASAQSQASSADYQVQQMQLQNQQLEIQINNLRDYYERDAEMKDHTLRLKEQEISVLKEEVEALRSGKSPDQVPRANAIQPQVQQNQGHRSEPVQRESPQRLGDSPNGMKYQSTEQPNLKSISDSHDVEPQPEDLQVQEGEIFKPNLDGYEAKTDALYLKGLLADKLLVYDDAKLKIGCIRSVSLEWRQATLKLYLGNKSQSEEVNGIVFSKELQFISIRDEDSQPFAVDPNDQLEVQIYVGSQVHVQPYVYFQYGQDQRVKLKLPVNMIFFCEPFPITPPQFLQFWKFTKNHQSMVFNMDLTRISNLQAVKKILTLNEKHGSFIQNIEAKASIVGYSANHLEGQVFAMLEISPSGNGSVMQVKSDISMEFSQSILECFLDMLSSRQM